MTGEQSTHDLPLCGQVVERGYRPLLDRLCKRRGYETYVRGKIAVRCWQHDPLRQIDEGEEAYKEHQWT